jgi:hypothetical protein
VRVVSADAYDPIQLPTELHVVFVAATAGQVSPQAAATAPLYRQTIRTAVRSAADSHASRLARLRARRATPQTTSSGCGDSCCARACPPPRCRRCTWRCSAWATRAIRSTMYVANVRQAFARPVGAEHMQPRKSACNSTTPGIHVATRQLTETMEGQRRRWWLNGWRNDWRHSVHNSSPRWASVMTRCVSEVLVTTVAVCSCHHKCVQV